MSALNEHPVALITGAGSGIGRAAAIRLAQEGWRIALLGRREAPLRETAELIGSDRRDGMLIIASDVSKEGSGRSTVDHVLHAWGRLDGLVNNAGCAPLEPIEETDRALVEDVFRTNVFGPAELILAAWTTFLAQQSGCVVNVSSLAAEDPFPGFFAYASSKCALESLTRSIMNEAGTSDICAFNIRPGAVETGMLRSIISTDDLPASRTLEPDVIAQVIVDCLLGRRDEFIGRVIRVPNE